MNTSCLNEFVGDDILNNSPERSFPTMQMSRFMLSVGYKKLFSTLPIKKGEKHEQGRSGQRAFHNR
jgi:hypothetical protein